MNAFVRVLDALQRSGVRYVIVGGFAAVMHGYNRATRDLDIVVDLEPSEARKAIEALVSLGFRSRAPVDPFSFADPEQRRRWVTEKGPLVFTLIDPANPMMAVDLFTEPPIEWAGLWGRARMIRVQDVDFRVCSLDDLIEMKTRSGRPQDLVDLEALRALRTRERPER